MKKHESHQALLLHCTPRMSQIIERIGVHADSQEMDFLVEMLLAFLEQCYVFEYGEVPREGIDLKKVKLLLKAKLVENAERPDPQWSALLREEVKNDGEPITASELMSGVTENPILIHDPGIGRKAPVPVELQGYQPNGQSPLSTSDDLPQLILPALHEIEMAYDQLESVQLEQLSPGSSNDVSLPDFSESAPTEPHIQAVDCPQEHDAYDQDRLDTLELPAVAEESERCSISIEIASASYQFPGDGEDIIRIPATAFTELDFLLSSQQEKPEIDLELDDFVEDPVNMWCRRAFFFLVFCTVVSLFYFVWIQ